VCNAIVAFEKPCDDDLLPPLGDAGALAHLRRRFHSSQFVCNRNSLFVSPAELQEKLKGRRFCQQLVCQLRLLRTVAEAVSVFLWSVPYVINLLTYSIEQSPS
jgi:hypothetical protein